MTGRPALTAEMIIVSANKKERSPRENDIALKQLSFILKRYGFTEQTPVLGKFMGNGEESLALFPTGSSFDIRQIEEVASIASMFQQDSILIERLSVGYLYVLGDREFHILGARRSSTEAPRTGDWTFLNGGFIQFK
jgi:hypothetical protein